MQSPQAKLKEITRLLGSWPSAAAPADGDEQLRSYMLAVEDYPADDVIAAVTALIKGVAPGVNPGFLPVPAVVGSECRRQMNLRLDRENREKRLRPALPAPTIHHSKEDRASVKAMVDELVERTGNTLIDTGEARRRTAVFDRTNEAFYPDMSDDAVMRRLGFSVGDPDAEADAA